MVPRSFKHIMSIITIQATQSFRIRTVYFFLASVFGDTRRETQFIKAYANHNMPTPTSTAQDLSSSLPVVTQNDLIWSDPKNPTATLEDRNPIPPPFQNPNSEDHLFQAWRHTPYSIHSNDYQAPFPIWKFIMIDDDCHILSAPACECAVWLWHLTKSKALLTK